MFALWNEFDASLIKVSDVHLGIKKIAGVRVPLLENVDFDIRTYSLFNSPKWYSDGIHLLKGLAQTAIEREFMLAKLNLLEHARKKTTQKVNLLRKCRYPDTRMLCERLNDLWRMKRTCPSHRRRF